MRNFLLVSLLIFMPAFTCSASSESSHIHHHSPHHISTLIGATHFEGGDTEPTVGIDYEYRVNDLLGLGLVVEYAGGGLDAWTYLAVADIHITNQFILQIGPGYEHNRDHDIAVGRVGAIYEFSWDEYTVSPQLHYDYHEGGRENGIVFGLAFGMAF